MPVSQELVRRARLSLRGLLFAFAALSSVLVLATCDLDKITAAKKEGTGATLNFAISGGSDVILAGTTALTTSPTFPGTVTRWSTSQPAVATIDSATGVVTGLTIGTTTITARLLSMELDSGFVKTQDVRVRYKSIRINPLTPIDSITGLGLTRTAIVRGYNAQDAIQPGDLTSGATLAIHDSGGTGQTIASLSGTVVKALKKGTAYLKAIYDVDRIDSVKVKVRPVAKNITFSDTVYTAPAMNFNRTIPITVKDVADSIIVAPVARWRSSDTTIVSIDSVTGVLRVKKADTARVTVRVDTVNRSTKVRLIQQVGSLAKSAGDAQTDTIGRLLPVALEVTALDSGGAAVPNAPVTFRIGAGTGAVITDSVKTTDASGKATLGSWTLGTSAGAQTVIATSGTFTTTFTATAVPAGARKLVFTVHPGSAAIATAIAPAIKVAVQDSAGNVVTSATNSVTLSFNTNPNVAATLGGTLTVAAVNGVATFSNITVSAGGSGFVLLASSGTLTNAVSNSFDVFGAATKLGFTTQPIGSSAGGLMQPVRVAVQDADGSTVGTATDSVSISLGNPGSAILSGTKKVKAVNGVATFSDLSVSAAGSGYTLVATATGRTGATSNTFTVSAVGTASRLSFSVEPSNAVSGTAIAPAVKVRVLDVNGALVTNSSQQITLSVENGTTISGTVSVAAVSGEATFSNVSIARAGTGYRLVATASGSSITSATSGTFNITAGAATKLGFVQQPTHTVVSTAMAPAVTVAVQDANGNTVTTHPATPVTVGLTGAGCTPSTLTGGGPANTTSGIATFATVTISATASNCALLASATGLTGASSFNFNIVATTGAVKLAFTTEPASSTTAGISMSGGTVNFQDASGTNAVAPSSTTITIAVLSGPTTDFIGTKNINATTSATFSNLSFTKAGTYRLIASAIGYDPDTSAAFTVNAGAANGLSFVTQPVTIVAGVPFPSPVQVAVVDQYQNVVTGATNVIQLSSSLTQSPFTSLRFNNGTFSATATAQSGIATFTGLSIYTAGVAARLWPSSSGLGGNSNIFDVAAAPLSALGFKTQPFPNYNAGATMAAIEVQGQDSVGNVVVEFANPITLTLIGGNPAAVLNGTKTVAPSGGISTFADLSINQAGSNYQLSATASGVSTATSTAFTINAGATTKIVWIDQPQNTFANAPLNPSGQLPRVANQDQYGNTTNDGWGMTITIANPTTGMKLRHNGFDQTQWGVSPDCGTSGCNGIATLPSELTVNTYGTGIQLLATSNNATYGTATSAAFNLAAFDTKSKLGFVQQPTNSSYGINFSPAVSLAIQDKYGNTDTTATETISLALSTNPGSATLSQTSLAATKGLATFTPLTLDKAGTGYVIQATATGLTSSSSGSFNVTTPGIVAQTNWICDMARTGTTIYFVDCGSSGKLWSVPVTGGTPQELLIGLANPQRIATDGTNVYWIEYGASNGSGMVRKYNITTKVATTMASGLFEVRSEANTFAIDETNVYFIARNVGGNTSGIRYVAKSVGGATVPTDLVAPDNCNGCAPFFTIASGFVFYYDFEFDAIRRIPVTGGTSVTLASGTGSVPLFALSGTTLLFSQRTNLKSIANATTISSAVTPSPQIESGLNFLNWTLDGTSLYVNNNQALQRYLTTDFAAVTNLGISLNNNTNQPIITDATDAFAYTPNGQIVKVQK